MVGEVLAEAGILLDVLAHQLGLRLEVLKNGEICHEKLSISFVMSDTFRVVHHPGARRTGVMSSTLRSGVSQLGSSSQG